MTLGILDQNHVSHEILTSLEKCVHIANETKFPANFQVKTYDGTPIMSVYGSDEIMYMGFFWRKQNCIVSPQLKLKCERGGNFYFSLYVKQHFESIWEGGHSINFNDTNWRKKL